MSLSDLRLLYMRVRICMNLSLPNPELHICHNVGRWAVQSSCMRFEILLINHFGKNFCAYQNVAFGSSEMEGCL